jgi:hypothetical protein
LSKLSTEERERQIFFSRKISLRQKQTDEEFPLTKNIAAKNSQSNKCFAVDIFEIPFKIHLLELHLFKFESVEMNVVSPLSCSRLLHASN